MAEIIPYPASFPLCKGFRGRVSAAWNPPAPLLLRLPAQAEGLRVERGVAASPEEGSMGLIRFEVAEVAAAAKSAYSENLPELSHCSLPRPRKARFQSRELMKRARSAIFRGAPNGASPMTFPDSWIELKIYFEASS